MAEHEQQRLVADVQDNVAEPPDRFLSDHDFEQLCNRYAQFCANIPRSQVSKAAAAAAAALVACCSTNHWLGAPVMLLGRVG
jgi:hypothetical protein